MMTEQEIRTKYPTAKSLTIQEMGVTVWYTPPHRLAFRRYRQAMITMRSAPTVEHWHFACLKHVEALEQIARDCIRGLTPEEIDRLDDEYPTILEGVGALIVNEKAGPEAAEELRKKLSAPPQT